MSVISSLTSTPNRIEIVLKTLAGLPRRSIGRQELISMLSPRALQRGDAEGGTTIAQGVLDEAVRLGLVSLEDGKYRLQSKDIPIDGEGLRSWLHDTLTFPGKAEAAGQADVGRALAWFMMQDPARPLAAMGRDVADRPRSRITEDFGPEVGSFELTIDARVQNFGYWARYLGYAWFLELEGKTAYVPDPTRAISRAIAVNRGNGKPLTIHEFLALIASRCPVLEGGAIRTEVEGLMTAEHRPALDRDGLSRATSLALHELEDDGVVELRHLADSRAVLLNSIAGARPVSHVSLRA